MIKIGSIVANGNGGAQVKIDGVDIVAIVAERDSLLEKVALWDRVLRASAPERCQATSPVGTVQNYIGELEQNNSALANELHNLLAELYELGEKRDIKICRELVVEIRATLKEHDMEIEP